MTITVFFDVNATAAQYDSIMTELATARATHPKGRLFHVAQPTKTTWNVVDVWESVEAFQEFGKTLMPIFAKVGVSEPAVQILPTHNLVRPPST